MKNLNFFPLFVKAILLFSASNFLATRAKTFVFNFKKQKSKTFLIKREKIF